ncbi:MAG TPA: hypothetical protein VF688_08110 [Allosphingosinicella sp.]|jgi:hypothetical protein
MAEEGASGRRRLLERAFVAAVGAGVVWAGWAFWHDRGLLERFTRVHLGMDRQGVVAALGEPDWEGPCTGYVGYLPRAACAQELGYSSAFAPVRPAYYMIQLDRSGRVIEAEPVRSR